MAPGGLPVTTDGLKADEEGELVEVVEGDGCGGVGAEEADGRELGGRPDRERRRVRPRRHLWF